MRVYDCVGIVNDLHGNIVGYQLRALDGTVMCLDAPKLKNALKQRIIAITNITYAKNNRLILKKNCLFDKKNLRVYDTLTFEMWLNNLLESIKIRYGGMKGVSSAETGNDAFYKHIYGQVADVPVAGGRKMDICLDLGLVVMGDRRNHLVLHVEDIISGITIDQLEIPLKAPLWCPENLKVVENAVNKVIIKGLPDTVNKWYKSMYNGGN